MLSSIRIGNLTSSDNHKLISLAKNNIDFGKPALTYIKEKRRERKLGVEIDLDSSAYPLAWGRAMEGYVFQNHIETAYTMQSDQTIEHPDKIFCGTPDFVSEDTVADLKCPFTRGSFCDLVEIIESKSINVFKEEKPEYYFQLISNSILTGKKFGELIVWMPYQSEFLAIVEYIENINDPEMQKDIQFAHVALHGNHKKIPFLLDSGYYKNINRFRFEIPKEDQDLLMEKIKKAHSLLIAK